MPEILRLTPSQRSRCNRLIKRLCANYDYGNCLLLDDGEPCVCPQTISYSLLCRYFHNAVLPAEKELYADIFRQRTYHCVECGAVFVPNSNRQKYCLSCSKRCTAGRKTRAQESAKWTIRDLKTPCFQGLFDAEPGCIKESYQPPRFRRSNCPNHKNERM